MYDTGSKIRFNTSMLGLCVCGFSDARIHVYAYIIVGFQSWLQPKVQQLIIMIKKIYLKTLRHLITA